VKSGEDVLHGGLADQDTDADHSDSALDKGQKIEMEHTTSPVIAREIARDHLTEGQDYYDRLEEMEEDMEKSALTTWFQKRAQDPNKVVEVEVELEDGKMEVETETAAEEAAEEAEEEMEEKEAHCGHCGKGGSPKKAKRYSRTHKGCKMGGGFQRGNRFQGGSKAAAWAIKLAEDDKDEKSEKDDDKPKKKKVDTSTKLGPIQHQYVADAMGGTAHERTGKAIRERFQDEDQGLFDSWLTANAPMREMVGKRIRRGASRMSENPGLRWLSYLDPTKPDGSQEGLVGLLASGGKTSKGVQDVEDIVKERYAKKLKKHQDPVDDPKGERTERETPWHMGMQGMLADKDSDIAGHRYMRKERPFNYWLNPLDRSGPLIELGDRLLRRQFAGHALPESTGGRFAHGLIPGLAMFRGGHDAQNKLRRAAMMNKIYGEEATPTPADYGEEMAKAAAMGSFLGPTGKLPTGSQISAMGSQLRRPQPPAAQQMSPQARLNAMRVAQVKPPAPKPPSPSPSDSNSPYTRAWRASQTSQTPPVSKPTPGIWAKLLGGAGPAIAGQAARSTVGNFLRR